MNNLALPSNPKDYDLEDYVAALLACEGLYLETSLIERSETEHGDILELDIMVWKPSGQSRPQHTLIEIKGGKNWGFADIFKVYGWKMYLKSRGIHTAYLIAFNNHDNDKKAKTVEEIKYMKQKCHAIGVELIVSEGISSLQSHLKTHGLTITTPDLHEHEAWRRSFRLERQMQKETSSKKRKACKNRQGLHKISHYQQLIKNGPLEAQDVRERVKRLYQAHNCHRRLAMSVATELEHDKWDFNDPSGGKYWKDALYRCQHPWVQLALYYQHRAKLDILKGAVEFALLQKHRESLSDSMNSLINEFLNDPLPLNFHKTVNKIQSIDKFEKIPVLWQSFLWKWGGFFLIDKKCEERETLAAEVGMTPKAVEDALTLYDTLFPIDNQWFINSRGTTKLKLFPCPFRGLGVHYRIQSLYSEDPKDILSCCPYDQQNLLNDLKCWCASTQQLWNGELNSKNT